MEKTMQRTQEPIEKAVRNPNIRITLEARDRLNDILRKVNSKEHGRDVKAGEVVALALSLVTSKEVKVLQEASLSNADRLELSYQKHIETGARISKDEWIGRLLKGEVRSDSF